MRNPPSAGFAARTAERFLLATVLLLCISATRAQQAGEVVVTALPVTYAITSALLEGTPVEVVNVPERGRPPAALGSYLESRAEELEPLYASASAVVTIGKLWSADPLYASARSGNIRIVDIDATKPWTSNLEGISVVATPVSDVPWADPAAQAGTDASPYFWLSPLNAARASDIVAADLARLFPDHAANIEENLLDLRRGLLELQLDFEIRLAAIEDVTVLPLASEFVYLTSDLGLFVPGYFLKQDIDWTDADLAALESYLSSNAIKVVLHKWEPDPRISEAIEAAGASLVVLDPLEVGAVDDGRLVSRSYFDILRANLESLHAALSDAAGE